MMQIQSHFHHPAQLPRMQARPTIRHRDNHKSNQYGILFGNKKGASPVCKPCRRMMFPGLRGIRQGAKEEIGLLQ